MSDKNRDLNEELISIYNYSKVLLEMSNELKKYRNINKLTQKKLGDILGVEQEMISKLENGNYNPTIKFLMNMWNLLDKPKYNIGLEMINKISNILEESHESKFKDCFILENHQVELDKLNFKVNYIPNEEINMICDESYKDISEETIKNMPMAV